MSKAWTEQDYEDLKEKYRLLHTPEAVVDIIKSRLATGNHAPNGTEELLAWILNLVDAKPKLKESAKLKFKPRDRVRITTTPENVQGVIDRVDSSDEDGTWYRVQVSAGWSTWRREAELERVE